MRQLFKVAALAAALVVGGCASTKDLPADQAALERQKNAALVEAGWALAKGVVALYTTLPRCGTPGATELCSDGAVVTQIVKAQALADVGVQEALDEIRKAPDQATVLVWVARGLSAVRLFREALLTYGIKS